MGIDVDTRLPGADWRMLALFEAKPIIQYQERTVEARAVETQPRTPANHRCGWTVDGH